MRRILIVPAAIAAALTARADTVILKSGKKLENVVVSVNDDERVIVNPWNSRSPDMKWEIGDEWIFAKEKVAEVVIADPPRVEYLRRASRRPLDSAAHFEIARFCEEHGMKDERAFHLEQCLSLDETHEAALAAYSEMKWKTAKTKNPALSRPVLDAAREYLAAADAVAAKDAWANSLRAGEKRPRHFLERARRSAAIPKGRRDRVKLTYESEKTPGATYCIFVPTSYDPLAATPLVVALHGGGPGGVDANIVEGSGEDAMPFYQSLAERWGFLIVAPTAVVAPWQKAENEQLIASLLAEMKILFNVDLTRVYVTGHSMGGFGSWAFGYRHPDWWTACAPCAGGGGQGRASRMELPVYVYHGSDDRVVPADMDRRAAWELRGDPNDKKKKDAKDFVYTELDGVGHSFPEWVRDDIFSWFAGRAALPSDRKKKFVGPISSFDAKPTKTEIATFGDPSLPPAETSGDDSLKVLLSDLDKGGGAGEQALETLRRRALEKPEEKTARALAALLDPEKRSVDTRVLATRALGAFRVPATVKLLAAAVDDPDYRVVEAAIDALAEVGGKESAPALIACSKRLAEYFERAKRDGDSISHTEYEVRLAGFGRLLTAFATIGDAAAFFPALERDVVKPVFLAKPRYTIPGDSDPRFADDSKNARAKLAGSLRACLVTLADPRGAELLRAIAAAWPNESKLVAECEAGAAELAP